MGMGRRRGADRSVAVSRQSGDRSFLLAPCQFSTRRRHTRARVSRSGGRSTRRRWNWRAGSEPISSTTRSDEVSTPAHVAFAHRHGVCQDFAHIMIAALRGLGLPALYVSGYIRTIPPPGKQRLPAPTPPTPGSRCGAAPRWVGWISIRPMRSPSRTIMSRSQEDATIPTPRRSRAWFFRPEATSSRSRWTSFRYDGQLAGGACSGRA